jgi:hypothetical protein
MMRPKFWQKYPLEVIVGPIIRSRVKQLKDPFNRVIQSILDKVNFKVWISGRTYF